LFEQANIAHTREEYQQAVDLYLTIIRSSGVSAPLLYNLANSYAALGKTGPAVLNYERALRLAPGDADIQANLDQVRKDAGLYRDDRPLYRRAAELLGADQWLLLAGFALVLLAISTLAANLVKGKRIILRLLTAGSLVSLLLTLPPALFRYQDWNVGVVQEDGRLLISPFADAASSGSIKAGRLIQPGRTHGDYVLVEDETGKSGWLARNGFALVAELPEK
jgi:tetratricopeptide (TPR) repeat protein